MREESLLPEIVSKKAYHWRSSKERREEKNHKKEEEKNERGRAEERSEIRNDFVARAKEKKQQQENKGCRPKERDLWNREGKVEARMIDERQKKYGRAKADE